MISELEKQRRFGVARELAKKYLPESIRDIAIHCVSDGYMQGKPVVIFNEHSTLIFGEQELSGIAGGDITVPVLVQYGISDDDWSNTEAPEFLAACRAFIYLQTLSAGSRAGEHEFRR